MENGNGLHSNGQKSCDREKKLIGYRGHWYDVATFIPHHPGGEVIEKFVGQDATCVIESIHKYDVMKRRRPGRICEACLQSDISVAGCWCVVSKNLAGDQNRIQTMKGPVFIPP